MISKQKTPYLYLVIVCFIAIIEGLIPAFSVVNPKLPDLPDLIVSRFSVLRVDEGTVKIEIRVRAVQAPFGFGPRSLIQYTITNLENNQIIERCALALPLSAWHEEMSKSFRIGIDKFVEGKNRVQLIVDSENVMKEANEKNNAKVVIFDTECKKRIVLREHRRFVRWLEEYLQEEIVVERGIYISIDTVFRIRRVIPDLPFSLVIGNAAGYRELRLRRVRILGPDRKVLQVFHRDCYLPSIKEWIDFLIARREKLAELLAEGRLLVEQEMMTVEERKRMEEIMKKAGEIFWMEYPKERPELHTISGRIDLTPYLREVGDEATIIIQADFSYVPETEEIYFTVEVPPKTDY